MKKKKKINLERIINNHIDTSKMNKYDKQAIINGFKQFGEQLLELAAENAILLDNGQPLNSSRYIIEKDDSFHCEVEIDIDKQSIIDTIKQVE